MVNDEWIELETMVPLGNNAVPLFRLTQMARYSFEDHVRQHDAVTDIRVVNEHDREVLYALNWDISADTFMQGIKDLEVDILEGSGGADTWGFQLRFRSHDTLSDFRTYCQANDIPIDINRIYNPTRPDAGPWYGLTQPQRSLLTAAVEGGYYDIPRTQTTQELAATFDISDQAVTERLRRGTANLVTNTLLVTADEDD